MIEKDENLIPYGDYCYSRDSITGKITKCPYHEFVTDEDFDKQNATCHFIEECDDDLPSGFDLWDYIKVCEINIGEDE